MQRYVTLFLNSFLLLNLSLAAMTDQKEEFDAATGLSYRRDSFGNVWPLVTSVSPEKLECALKDFVQQRTSLKSGNAFMVALPHAQGNLGAALLQAGFSFHHGNNQGTEWIIKNESPIPDAATAIAGARVIVRQGDNVLVIEDRNMSGRMIFPGGSVDGKERLKKAAQRELKEEVNLKAKKQDLQLVALTNRVMANRYGMSDYCFYYTTNNTQGEVKIQEKEIKQALWVPLADLAKSQTLHGLKISPTTRAIAAHIISKGRNSSQILPDVRQYSASQKDPKDTMTLELFEMGQNAK